MMPSYAPMCAHYPLSSLSNSLHFFLRCIPTHPHPPTHTHPHTPTQCLNSPQKNRKRETMGVDLTGISKKSRVIRHHTYSTNPYIKLLIKLYKFLAKRTSSGFNKIVYQRLIKSRSNRAPISLSRIAVVMKRKAVFTAKSKKAPIAVVVGDVLDDVRMARIPAMRVCALRFSKSARQSIVAAGGECLTFDQLAMVAPTGKNTYLLRGRKSGRESVRHFGASGVPGSHSKPHATNRGKETKRGRRTGQSYKRKAFRHV
ncbi:60S ribosomal protein L18, putative [Leishmania tarentolae]|uniref:60S ribosomal protein L18, putative n=1 Tax=Leishmania tarentolae TaxID=5689 RepID=A0A640KCP0_LEITA|nr:60S ribosomal protein L18, putative [Leishmania tarentolae]